MQGQGEIMPNNEVLDSNKVFWYVMLHLDPSTLDKLIKLENEKRKEEGKSPFLSLIPFLFLERAAATKGQEPEDNDDTDAAGNNTLRDYLHDFVFIKSSRKELDQLLDRDWNRSGRLHLHYCRSHEGHPIRITEQEMTPFIALFVEHHQKFSFRPFNQDTLHAQTVHIKKGLFKGYSATVHKIVQTADGFKLSLELPVFNNEFMLELYECADTDVDIPGGELEQVFGPYFIQNMEQELFDILRRRVFRRETQQTQRQDPQRLDSYSIFNYLKFDDTAQQTHFQSLMLLCASLRNDKPTKDALIRELITLMTHPETPSSDEEAFMTAILFVATRKGILRKAAKEYCQTHPVNSTSLQRLMPLIKEIRTR